MLFNFAFLVTHWFLLVSVHINKLAMVSFYDVRKFLFCSYCFAFITVRRAES